MEEAVAHLVETTLGGQGWEVRRPEHGWSDRSYVAAREGRRVFVKLGTPAAILERVAALGVAPPVLAIGELNAVPFAIQDFVEGNHASHQWVVDHQHAVAALLRTIHQDSHLRAYLDGARRVVYQLDQLDLSRRAAAEAFGLGPDLRAADQWLIANRPSPPATELVPTHGDISPKNFLVSTLGLLMVDWEDAALADPMRDLGPLLWWYFPPSHWSAFMEHYGTALTPALTLRAYWWAACISLDITAGLLERGYREEAAGFLADFLAAAAELPNPRPSYRGLDR